MEAYLNTVASMMKVPAEHRTVWKQTVLISKKILTRLEFTEDGEYFVAKTDINDETYTFKFYNTFKISISEFKHMLLNDMCCFYTATNDNIIYVDST